MRTSCPALLAAALLTGAVAAEEKERIRLENVAAPPPAFQTESPTSMLHVAQYRLKGPQGDAQLLLYRNVHDPKRTVEGWMGQFTPPKGRTLDDVTRFSVATVAGHKATRLEMSGTWEGRHFDIGEGKGPQDGYKMVVICFERDDALFQIRLVGPACTVDGHLKEFDDWIKAFR
jgi:hypothetical protein